MTCVSLATDLARPVVRLRCTIDSTAHLIHAPLQRQIVRHRWPRRAPVACGESSPKSSADRGVDEPPSIAATRCTIR